MIDHYFFIDSIASTVSTIIIFFLQGIINLSSVFWIFWLLNLSLKHSLPFTGWRKLELAHFFGEIYSITFCSSSAPRKG